MIDRISPPAPTLARRGLVLAWLASIPFLGVLYLKIPPSPDQMQFDYMAWLATQGVPYYSGTFDMNWPGGMILQEIAIRLFGPRAYSWHLADFLMLQAVTLAMALFLHRAGFDLARFIVLPLYPTLYVTSGYWMAGQRDVIAVGLLLGACAAMLAGPRHERRSFLIAGMLTACAVLVRPTYLSVLAGLIILEAAPRAWVGIARKHGTGARIGLLVAGFLLPFAVVVGAGVWIGNLDDWYQQSVVFTSLVYRDKPPLDPMATLRATFFGAWHWLTFCAAFGLFLWVRRDGRLSYPAMLVSGLGAAIALSYFAQNKGFGYHLGGALPILVLLTAVAVDGLATWARTARAGPARTALRLALVLTVLLVCAGTFKKLWGEGHYLADIAAHGMTPVPHSGMTGSDQARMVAMIKAGTGADDRIVQFGTLYQIPYLAGRHPSHRFITPAIELMTRDFPLYTAWMGEITESLHRTQPPFVLIEHQAVERTGDVLRPRKPGTPVLTALLDYVGTDYSIVMQGDYGYLLKRNAD